MESRSLFETNRILIAFTALIWATSFWRVQNNYFVWAFALYSIYIGWQTLSKPTLTDGVLFLPLILFMIYVVGLLWSIDFHQGFRQVEKRLVLAVFPIVFFFLKNKISTKNITGMLYTFLIFCVGLSLVCYAYAAWQSIHHGSFKVVGQTERVYYYFSYMYLTYPVDLDPIYVSLYVNFSIIILLFRPLNNKVINVFLILYLVLFNVLVASKAGMIALLLIFSLWCVGRIRNKVLAFGICLVALTAFVSTVTTSKFLSERFIVSTQFNYESPWAGDWNSTSQRLAIWTSAVETIGKVFPLGYGTSNGQLALNQTYKSKNYIRGYEDKYNAHSEYLFALLDTGIFGIVVIILMFLWPGIQSLKNKDLLFLYFLILIFFYFFVETVLARRSGGVFVSFFYSLLALNGLIEKRRIQIKNPDEI
jgi:O-antigen ligase